MAAASVVPVLNNDAATAEEDFGMAAASRSSSWPAAVADRYKHPVKLGQGFYGRVYAAWDTIGEQLVAVKQLSARTDGEVVATGPCEFAQEVSTLAACRGHPNVVKLLAAFVGDNGDDYFVVTELAGRTDLRRYARDRGLRRCAEDEVRDVMRQLLSAAARAHAAGVVHREVVPENVVVDDDHRHQGQRSKKKTKQTKYTLCGFNASERAAGGAANRDGSSRLASASAYRAPELFLGSDDYDERVDSWSLGCIMAELLDGCGGEPYFYGRSDDEVFQLMLGVVGASGVVEWSGFDRVAATPQQAAELREAYQRETGCLRRAFPKETLSQAGFDVLSGLLQSNPDRRITAAAALKMPWFHRRRHGLSALFCSA